MNPQKCFICDLVSDTALTTVNLTPDDPGYDDLVVICVECRRQLDAKINEGGK